MKFNDEFFIALNQWQKGWSEDQERKNELASILKNECEKIEQKYKTVDCPCYRKRYLHKGELVDIIIKDNKKEGVTSWTTDVRYAEFFKGLYRDNAVTAAIFEHTPTKDEVILDINKLWECEDFIKDLKKFKERKPDQCDAIYHFEDGQNEVILEVPLRGSEICILSGKSSPFDDICDSANIPEEERPAVFKELIDNGAFIEEIRYVKNKAACNAIKNTIRSFYELIQNNNYR